MNGGGRKNGSWTVGIRYREEREELGVGDELVVGGYSCGKLVWGGRPKLENLDSRGR